MTHVKRLLIYRFGQIGDTVAALPALWHLRAQFPDAHFTLLSEIPLNGSHLPPEKVLPPSGLIQSYFKYQSGSSLAGRVSQISTILRLKLGRFDAIAYLLPSIRSSSSRLRDERFFKLTGIPTRFGFHGFPDDAHPRLPNRTLQSVPHEADALLQRLAKDGFPPVPSGMGRMDLGLTAVEHQIAGSWLSRHGLSDGPWFALCQGSKWPSKCWPEDRYYNVVSALFKETGMVPIIFGGAEDRAAAQRLIQKLGFGHCAAGDLSVRESAALLQRSRFYLGNDTGVMHLAAAVRTPCVAIFASIDWPGRWSPYGSGHEVLRFPVPCAGCLAAECAFKSECLTGIHPPEVLAACHRVLNRQPAPH
jgi:heptosyltransferase-3